MRQRSEGEMSVNIPAVVGVETRSVAVSETAPRQADSDRHLVELWIGRHASRHTRRNYGQQAERFLAFVRRPLAEVRIGDLQDYVASLDGVIRRGILTPV